jgi:hypothetical protein
MTTKTLTLYELTNQWRELLDFLANTPADEIDMESFDAEMAELEGDLTAKMASVACFLKETDLEAAAVGLTINHYQERKARLESTVVRLKEYLLRQMTAAGIDRVSDPRIEVKRRKNPPKLKITDREAIPPQWWRQPPIPEMEPDKTIIKAALKAGQAVPGAELETTERLEIK